MNNNPFSELKIVELASVLAGPSVGQFFAELGAKVYKIENPNTKGDVTRSWKLPSEDVNKTVSSYYASANWGKENIIADISTDKGLSIVYNLIKEADVVIASYKPGDAQKLKVDYEMLKKLNPTIIYGLIIGYGENINRVGYDAIIQAETGFTYMNGERNGNPVKMPVAMMDLMAAHQLKEGILAALYVRAKTGKGDCVSVSLFEAGVSSLANQATNYLMANHIPERIGSDHPNIVPYGTLFTTKDEKLLVLAIGSDKQFEALCTVLGCAELAKDSRFLNQL
jgi:crotonobetainyl-CoA:carnitine CoA-transferase CaiB-like acyl-CoA transferase